MSEKREAKSELEVVGNGGSGEKGDKGDKGFFQSSSHLITQSPEVRRGGNTMKSKLNKIVAALGMAALFVAGVGVVGKVHAVVGDTVTIRVTISINLSVDIATTAYTFSGITTAGAVGVSTGNFPVTNDSGGLTEDLLIKGYNSANWSLAPSSAGVNTFMLHALMSTATNVVPLSADFTARASTVTLSNLNMSEANVGFNGTAAGNNITSGVANRRYMWLRLSAPTEITQGNNVEQNIQVEVTAADSSTF